MDDLNLTDSLAHQKRKYLPMKSISRRTWIQSSAAVSCGFWLGTTAEAKIPSANDKLNLAFIGVGGRGAANLGGLSKQNLVAFCDVDGTRAKAAFEKYPNVPRYTDYRKMLDNEAKNIDGVVISTPDHTHFHPAYQALQLGKHVYLEKPMAHNLWETRTLTELAKKQGVATQLGVQRHTLPNMHRSVELIQSGAIGDVTEVYCWVEGSRGMPGEPKDKPPIPANLDYELWTGPAPARPYHPSITPYGWRFWWDYGTGETGNWACHILDIPFWALDLKYPTRVTATGPKVDPLMTPKSMKTTFQFPASGSRGPIAMHWDHVANGPDVLRKHKLPNKGYNTLFIGSDGMLLTGFSKLKLYPEAKFADFEKPAASIPPSPGFYQEWITACQGGQPATCDFAYSGPLAEAALLGNLAYRSQQDFDWDSKNLQTSSNEANRWIKTPYKKGWEIKTV